MKPIRYQGYRYQGYQSETSVSSLFTFSSEQKTIVEHFSQGMEVYDTLLFFREFVAVYEEFYIIYRKYANLRSLFSDWRTWEEKAATQHQSRPHVQQVNGEVLGAFSVSTLSECYLTISHI